MPFATPTNGRPPAPSLGSITTRTSFGDALKNVAKMSQKVQIVGQDLRSFVLLTA